MTDGDATYVSFCGRINPDTTESLLGTCVDQANEGAKTIYLLLSSPGGSVDSAIAAYNVLRGMPFRLITHNVGTVDSMGNVLFLAGDERYACPNSSFTFHGVGFSLSSDTRFEIKNLREKMDSVEDDQRKIAAIIAERTHLDADEIGELFLESVTRDPEYARANGIVDSIRELEIPEGARIIQLRFHR
jgi:ATP-dependent protease ClpP protease subunit